MNKETVNLNDIELEEEFEDDSISSRNSEFRENAIEWYNGQKTITITLSQRKLINKIMKYAKDFPNEVKIDSINEDGTVLAHIPLTYLKIQKPRMMSEDDKNKARERLQKYHKSKKENSNQI